MKGCDDRPMFQGACSKIQVREALTQKLYSVAPSWIAPHVRMLDQSCRAGRQASSVSAVWLSS